MNSRILVIDGDPETVESLNGALHEAGFEIDAVFDGRQGAEAARDPFYVLIVLDLVLPGLPGLDVLRAVRRAGDTPVLVLSRRSEELDRIVALEVGADDFVAKPFSAPEVVARICAVLRRSGGTDAPTATGVLASKRAPVGRGSSNAGRIMAPGVVMDLAAGEITIDGVSVALRPREWDLLETLLRHPGRVMSRESLMDLVWGKTGSVDSGSLDVHIRWLRQKIERVPDAPTRILTVRRIGYKYAG